MQQYEIILKNEKQKSYKTSLLVIILLNLLAFIFLAYVAKEKTIQERCIWVAACLALSLIFDFLIKSKKRLDFRGGAVFLIIAAYFLLGYFWLAITMILISFLYLLAIRKLIVHISEKIISYPSIPGKKIRWDQLNNMMLKDDVLTIDFKNNKLIQHYTEQHFSEVYEQEFNDFCRQQLMSKKSYKSN